MPEIKIRVKGYRCNNCDNTWIPISVDKKPLVCPKCKSPRWDMESRIKKSKKLKTKIKKKKGCDKIMNGIKKLKKFRP